MRANAHRITAAAPMVAGAIVLGLTVLVISCTSEAPFLAEQAPLETPRNAGPAEDAGWSIIAEPDHYTDGPKVFIERLGNGTWVGLDPGWPQGDMVPAGDPAEVLWTSADGTTWQRQEMTAFEGRVIHHNPASWRGSVLAGLLWVWTAPIDATEAMNIWISEDGATWHRVEWDDEAPIDLSPQPGPVFLKDEHVVFFTEVIGSWGTETARSFVSTDTGRSFQRLSVFPPETTFVLPWSGLDGLRALVSGVDMPPELWRSSDGVTWERIGKAEGVDMAWDPMWNRWRGWIALSASPDAVLIGGYSSDGSVLRSTDQGRTWEHLDVAARVPLDEDRGFDFRNSDLHAVGTTGDWLLIQGNYRTWATRDGIEWVHFSDTSSFESMFGSVSADYVYSGGLAIPPEG